jgi:hypothetical protein
MASRQHLKILTKGVPEWNEWLRCQAGLVPDLSRAHLSRANLLDANLSHANLSHSDLSHSDLTGADLSHSDLTGADLRSADLTGAKLSHARLTGAKLNDAKLIEASLTSADLNGANLSFAKLTEANLSGANLKNSNLYAANLTNANFSDVFLAFTAFAFVDLSTAKGLETVRHSGPCSIGIETLYVSQGKIPKSFLRGAGVPDNFITYAKSLTDAAIEFHSVFISYSSRDQEFADRLYADLQAKGVRCWFAPEHLKIGDEFRSRIDESIRIQDKLLLVLSAESIMSVWVKKEVETAFERERRERRTVLFPIRLDYAIEDTNEAWAADIRRTRHIGNFSAWNHHDMYKKAFDRLLRDLKTEDDKKAEPAGTQG